MKNIFACRWDHTHARIMVVEFAPLEDEVGDVLDKAMRLHGLNVGEISRRSGIAVDKLQDALDYRYDLSESEIRTLASLLNLRAEGLLHLLRGSYPLPEISGLPACVYPLRQRHGIGVANAYLIADCCSDRGILFDTGSDFEALQKVWPKTVKRLEAIFLTQQEGEHSGGLNACRAHFANIPAFGPVGCGLNGVVCAGEGGCFEFGRFSIEVFRTPGHVEAHNVYRVKAKSSMRSPALLFCGDLLFAGSIGGGFNSSQELMRHLGRIFRECADDTVLAPGHGPLTTIKNERMNNPFIF